MKLLFYTGFIQLLLMSALAVKAQDNDVLNIILDKEALQPGDTLVITADYLVNGTRPPKATLLLNLINENNASWKFRWPLLGEASSVALIIPDSIPHGRYRLFFSAVQTFFAVKGKVINPSGLTSLKTLLLTTDGKFTQRDVSVDRQGYFEYANNLFPGEASLIFSRKDGGDNTNLDINISTVLDSLSLLSGTMVKRQVSLGRRGMIPAVAVVDTMLVAADTSLLGQTKTLADVTVFGRRKTPAEIFDDRYVTGWFKSSTPRAVFDLTDNPTDAAGTNVSDYLKSKAGMLVFGYNARTTLPVVRWWGEEVTFYLNEVRTTLQEVSTINTRNVAFIKLYPPPFFGNELAGGGAVVVYTKRGVYDDENGNRSKFRVNGYSPVIANMSANPDRF